jgi:hypothetical protein
MKDKELNERTNSSGIKFGFASSAIEKATSESTDAHVAQSKTVTKNPLTATDEVPTAPTAVHDLNTESQSSELVESMVTQTIYKRRKATTQRSVSLGVLKKENICSIVAYAETGLVETLKKKGYINADVHIWERRHPGK